MPGITERGRRSGAGWIGGDGDDEEDKPISYCPSCEDYGFKAILGPSILLKGEPRPSDYDLFLQCTSCGRTYPVHKIKKEDKTKDVIEIETNPFDVGKSVVGLDNKRPQDRKQRERQRLLDKIDKEKDEDIKAALKRGAIVEIIEEAMEF